MVKPVPTGIDRESKEPVRLFESDFLEFFTHISPIVVLVVWVPVVVYFLLVAILIHPDRWLYIPIRIPGRTLPMDIVGIPAAPLCVPFSSGRSF